MAYAAYIGFYPTRNVLKTWRSMGITGYNPDEVFQKAVLARDDFLLDNNGFASLQIDIEVRARGKRVDLKDWRAAMEFLHEHPVDRSRFPKNQGGTKVD